MLRSLRDLMGYRAWASDGEVGSVVDFYFDDARWTIRYLVVDTGGWLSGRQVLLSPFGVSGVDWDAGAINLRQTRDQVQRSPGIDTALTVSRVQESQLNQHYGWPSYWNGGNLWGPSMWPSMPVPGGAPMPLAQPSTPSAPPAAVPADAHLRSTNEVLGYRIQAQDGELGKVEDFLLDDETWTIQAMVVDTTPWWPGGEVGVKTDAIAGVVWEQREVSVKMAREALKQSPQVDLSQYTHRK